MFKHIYLLLFHLVRMLLASDRRLVRLLENAVSLGFFKDDLELLDARSHSVVDLGLDEVKVVLQVLSETLEEVDLVVHRLGNVLLDESEGDETAVGIGRGRSEVGELAGRQLSDVPVVGDLRRLLYDLRLGHFVEHDSRKGLVDLVFKVNGEDDSDLVLERSNMVALLASIRNVAAKLLRRVAVLERLQGTSDGGADKVPLDKRPSLTHFIRSNLPLLLGFLVMCMNCFPLFFRCLLLD